MEVSEKCYILLISLVILPCLAISETSVIGFSPIDSNAVHKWELWDSDLNITGTERVPYIKAGNTDFAEELKLAGVESLFTGLVSISNSSAYPFLAMSQGTTNTTSNAAAVVLSYGEHDNPGGANVFSVYRLCNLTSSGFCNVGPIAGFGDLSNTLFPNEALDINSDWTGSSQVLRVNGFFLDPSMPVVYLANIATSPAIKVDDGTMVCPNLNADMVDGYSLDQDVTTLGNPSFSTVTATSFYGKADNATYSDDSDMLDGHHWSEIITSKVDNATYADFSGDSDMVDSKHADDFLWLDGSKTMVGDLDMGVYPVASSLGSLSFKVKDGNYFLFLNETGDITTMLSDKGQLYLYDFLGGSNYLGIMYLANNAYISSSSGGITFEPNSYLVNVIGNITANRFIGKSDNSTYSDDSHKLDGYHYNTLPTLRNNTYSYVEQNNTNPDGYSWDFFGSNSAGNHVVGMGMLTAPSGGSSYLTVQNMFNTTDGLRFILQPINDINKTATTGAKLVMYGNYYGTDYLSLWNDANHTGNLNVSGGNLTLQPNGYNVGIRTLYPNYTLDVLGDMRATNLYSSDGTKGITNTTGFWMCTDSSCTNKCQAQIKNGLITGCT